MPRNGMGNRLSLKKGELMKEQGTEAALLCEGSCKAEKTNPIGSVTLHHFHGTRSGSEITYVIFRCSACGCQRVYGTLG